MERQNGPFTSGRGVGLGRLARREQDRRCGRERQSEAVRRGGGVRCCGSASGVTGSGGLAESEGASAIP